MINSINTENTRKYYILNSNSSKKNTVNYQNNDRNLQFLDRIAELNKAHVSFGARMQLIENYSNHTQNNYTGCLLGGAIGDALGTPVDDITFDSIREKHGKKGITDFILENGVARVSEDTQLTLLTAMDMLYYPSDGGNVTSNLESIYNSYTCWQYIQSDENNTGSNGSFSIIKVLAPRRKPGYACYKALQYRIPGSVEFPVNNSANIEGLMRTAPIGLKLYKNPQMAFELGVKIAAMTHGSPTAYLSAGMFAAIIANIIQGKTLEAAVDDSLEIVRTKKKSANIIKLVEDAKQLAKTKLAPKAAIKRLGKGWNADEALAMGIYCALKSPDNFEQAVLAAVNHDGDSNSTAAITGHILGACLGKDKIPDKWINNVELSEQIYNISSELFLQTKNKETQLKQADKKTLSRAV